MSIDYINEELHGKDGPIPVTIPDVYGPFQASWVKTLDNLGWCNSDDPIEGEKLGTFACGLSIDAETKTRGYAASAYYTQQVAERPNLEVLTETFVEKILTNVCDGSVQAIGVKIRTRSGVHEITAKKEVILAAGSLHSPQLLQVSGIGDPKVHTKIGVATVVDLPAVGQNLQDHVLLTVVNSRTSSLVAFRAIYENHHLRS